MSPSTFTTWVAVHPSRAAPVISVIRFVIAGVAVRQDKAQTLLGRLDESELEEQEARADVSKWEPVRHFTLVMIPRGRSFIGNELRLYARGYVRDNFSST